MVEYRGLNPPQSVGRKARSAIGLKSGDGDCQSQIGFGPDIGKRRAVSLVPSRNLSSEPQVACHEFVGGLSIPELSPSSRKLLFLLGLEPALPASAGHHSHSSSLNALFPTWGAKSACANMQATPTRYA